MIRIKNIGSFAPDILNLKATTVRLKISNRQLFVEIGTRPNLTRLKVQASGSRLDVKYDFTEFLSILRLAHLHKCIDILIDKSLQLHCDEKACSSFYIKPLERRIVGKALEVSTRHTINRLQKH